MKDILFFAVVGVLLYVFYRVIMKEPIIPSKKKKGTAVYEPSENQFKNSNKKKNNTVDPLEEDEAAPFGLLFPNVQNISSHMIRHVDNHFVMVAEAEPVNYFLLDNSEQDGIDAILETWLAQINYHTRVLLQNRFVDLTEPINEIRKNMDQEEDMDPLAVQFGLNMIKDLQKWQNAQPRYETRRYILFPFKVDPKDIKAEDSEDLEDRIVEKAWNELNRRVNTAKTQLRKSDVDIHLLTTDGINEVLYYQFNRRKAVKNRYRDIEEQEMLSLYVTADQTAEQIVRVKGEIENAQKEEKESAS